ncbi:MAG: efflux RND transporter permease subunit [Methylotenera sp.]|uniref:efflux RND transporter permease subunit n=1 Tax=Methylotenera sp. TaxID=2051956 RepID=UPI0024891B3B|nr:efflux RND transporter permease subunit [Methylotenera sp.]MDI1310462.1 efflux RND transporter permease subunit [Methylotenera sp.]
MLKNIIYASVNNRHAVLLFSLILILVGLFAAKQAPLDVFPEFAPIKVEIQTEAPGLSTEETEQLISMPLEQMLNGTPQLKTLRSKSVVGLSSVVMLFEEGTDIHEARQFVQERLSLAASRLPVVAKPPVLMPPLSSLSRVLKIGVSSKQLSQMDVSNLTMWTIRPRLMSVAGVANVAVWGQRDKQLQIIIDPNRLRAFGLSMPQIMKAVGDASSIESGGFVDTPNQRIALRHKNLSTQPEELAKTVVDFKNGSAVKLGDVAEITIGSPPPIGDAVINNGDGLLLIVEKHPNANTIEVTKNVELALTELKPALHQLEIDSTIFRPATFIERAIQNLQNALLIGAILVMVILMIFLRNKRAAFISICAIPLSLITAVLVLTAFNIGINTMVIAGLVIALGEVVDDAIIDVENIIRRLKLNQLLVVPKSKLKVIVNASLEVRSSVVYATMIVMVVFLPVLFLDGIAGAFFKPLATAYLLAILASLVVALTVTPALSYFLLKSDSDEQEISQVTWLRSRYANILDLVLINPKKVVITTVLAFSMTGVGSLFLGSEFLPEFEETDFLMHFLERPGSSIEQMKKMSIRASNDLLAIPGVNNFGAHIGRAEAADEVVGPNFTELWISVDPEVNYDKTVASIKNAMQGYSGIFADVQTYLKERSKEVLSGTSSSIVVRLFGPDLAVLRQQAEAIKNTMQLVDGVTDLKIEPQVLVPQIEIRLKQDAAQSYGINTNDIRKVTSMVLKGIKVGEVYESQQKLDVVIIGNTSSKSDLSAIQQLPIDSPFGSQLRIKDVADVYFIGMPNEIKREAVSRRIDIVSNAKNRDLGAVAADIENSVLKMQFPAGYYPQFLGEYTAQKAARNRLAGLSILMLLAIVLIVYADFKSYRHTLVLVASLPFAFVGGVIGVLISGGVVSLGSMVGFIAVLGIAARNGILLISHYRHLMLSEKLELSSIELIKRGSNERLVPILMTALATSLALLPIVFKGPISGYEIEYPLAIVVVSGLLTSTILNLLLLPAIFLKYGMKNINNSYLERKV